MSQPSTSIVQISPATGNNPPLESGAKDRSSPATKERAQEFKELIDRKENRPRSGGEDTAHPVSEVARYQDDYSSTLPEQAESEELSAIAYGLPGQLNLTTLMLAETQSPNHTPLNSMAAIKSAIAQSLDQQALTRLADLHSLSVELNNPLYPITAINVERTMSGKWAVVVQAPSVFQAALQQQLGQLKTRLKSDHLEVESLAVIQQSVPDDTAIVNPEGAV
jgi:hypothetical protein